MVHIYDDEVASETALLSFDPKNADIARNILNPADLMNNWTEWNLLLLQQFPDIADPQGYFMRIEVFE